ncbi:serine/threonine-protein kinase [Anabaena azotica]|uniref:non-specific serine/threonine protein kinase n=1 Tax=Anabaena azotica FACHB-119 TaxID=947527 RepID=A0ABR8DAG5_9NOST|nr:serine/threonine-protein kinase [Anabaena azotica]MBD2504084.1 serine/threonine protein kinase [Anabaena azotica FACHB-119]
MAGIIGGHYRIIKHLSNGGFGKTFLAEDIHLPDNPLCVVKQLMPTHQGLPLPKNSPIFQVAQRLFNTEAQVLYKLGEHPQIPKLFAHFKENQEFYLVQEFIEGTILKEEINDKQWNEAQVIDLLSDILTTLAFIHQHKVIHRDLKPDNLIRRKRDNKIVLIDFGAVKEIMSQATSSGRQSQLTVVIGTPGYIPSEQFKGKPNLSSDVYAVGVIAIQALTGLHPVQLSNDADDEIDWHRYTQVNPRLAEILNKMVRQDYHQRYRSASEALEAILKLNSQPKKRDNKKLIFILISLLLSIVVGVVVLSHTIDIRPPKNEAPTQRKIPAF